MKSYHYEKEIGLGVYDIHSPRVPLKEETIAALNAMVEAAKEVR